MLSIIILIFILKDFQVPSFEWMFLSRRLQIIDLGLQHFSKANCMVPTVKAVKLLKYLKSHKFVCIYNILNYPKHSAGEGNCSKYVYRSRLFLFWKMLCKTSNELLMSYTKTDSCLYLLKILPILFVLKKTTHNNLLTKIIAFTF